MDKYDYAAMGCHPNGQPYFRVWLLSIIAKVLNIQFKLGGVPYGASYAGSINTRWRAAQTAGSVASSGSAWQDNQGAGGISTVC